MTVEERSSIKWKAYSVRRADKEPLLSFVIDALQSRGCKILHTTPPNFAPFYIVYESAGGVRQGLLVYAFLANKKKTTNRPEDEHRFQVKYGGNLQGVLEVTVDPLSVFTTIFLGIDTERQIFVAADPLMNTPAPMSRSIEFKQHHVERILAEGWCAWERSRRPAKSKHRPAYQLENDNRIEVLVGGRKERLLDLITLERVALGLDPSERHLVADKLNRRPPPDKRDDMSHALLDEFDVTSEALLDLIEGASRLKMAVRGWVAEKHLRNQLESVPGVSECSQLLGDGQPDISLRWKGSHPILIECKNTLRETYADRVAKVDFQRTRASKSDPCSRYYEPTEFSVLAACLHAVSEKWEFRFALTSELPPHKKCSGRISNLIRVENPMFTESAQEALEKASNVL